MSAMLHDMQTKKEGEPYGCKRRESNGGYADRLYRGRQGAGGGLRGGDLIVLAARPRVGKSAFALNIATNAAKSGATVIYFSLEMLADHVMQRILCSEARVSLHRLRRGSLQEDERNAIINAADALSGLELYIDDAAGLSLLEMRAKARRQLRDKKKGLIIVDYLQLMEPSLYSLDVNSVVWCADISRGLKALAKETDMLVLALYNLHSLRGAIESKRCRAVFHSRIRQIRQLHRRIPRVRLRWTAYCFAPYDNM